MCRKLGNKSARKACPKIQPLNIGDPSVRLGWYNSVVEF